MFRLFSSHRATTALTIIGALLLVLGTSPASAQQDCSTDGTGLCTYIPIGSTVSITPKGMQCALVTNNCANPNNDALMVPFSTSDEWTSFLASEIVNGGNGVTTCAKITPCSGLKVAMQAPNPGTVAPGGSTNLKWVITGNTGNVTCTTSSTDGSWPQPVPGYPFNINETANVTPTIASGPVTYQLLNCTDDGGQTQVSSKAVNINVAGVNCPSGQVTWLNNCGANLNSIPYDPKNKGNDDVQTVENTNPSFSGQETATCQADGTWAYAGQTCNNSSDTCPILPGGENTVLICDGSCGLDTFKTAGCPSGNIGDTCTVRSLNCAEKFIPCAEPPNYICNVCEPNVSTLVCAQGGGQSPEWTGVPP